MWSGCSWPRGSLRQSQRGEERGWRRRSLRTRTLAPGTAQTSDKESSTSASRHRDSRWPVRRDEVSAGLSSGQQQLRKQQLLQRHPLSHLLLRRERQMCEATRAPLTPSPSPFSPCVRARPPSRASPCDALTGTETNLFFAPNLGLGFFSCCFSFLNKYNLFKLRPMSEAKWAAPAALPALQGAAAAPAKAEPSALTPPARAGKRRQANTRNPLHRLPVVLRKRQHPWKGTDQSNCNQRYRGRDSCPRCGLSITLRILDAMQSRGSSTSLPRRAWGQSPLPTAA